MEPQAYFYIAGTNQQVSFDGYQMWRRDSVEIEIVVTPIFTLVSPSFRWTAKYLSTDTQSTIEKSGVDFTIVDPVRPTQIDLKFSLLPTDTENLTPSLSGNPNNVSVTSLIWDFQITANNGNYVKTFPKGRYGRLSIAADLSIDAP